MVILYLEENSIVWEMGEMKSHKSVTLPKLESLNMTFVALDVLS